MLSNKNMIINPNGKVHELLIRIFNIILVLLGIYVVHTYQTMQHY